MSGSPAGLPLFASPMPIFLYLLGLLSAILLVGGTLCKFWRRPTPYQALQGLLPAFGACVILSILTSHLCLEGRPFHLALLAAVGTWLLVACVRSQRATLIAGAASLALLGQLSFHHVRLSHTRYFTDNPEARSLAPRGDHSRPSRRIVRAWHTGFTFLYEVKPSSGVGGVNQ